MIKDNSAIKLFKMVIPLMNQNSVDPTPRNYHVWYEYVTGDNKYLVAEIDDIFNQSRPFSNELCDYLYRKYILTEGDKKAIEDAGEHAKKLLSEVVRLVDMISGENVDYGKDLDDFAVKLKTQIKGDVLKPVVDSIVEKTKKIKEKGVNVNKKLEASNAQIVSLQKNLDEIRVESSRDFLTGVYNRKAFQEKITQLTADARASKEPLCLLMMDVDHFKKYNDTYGHQLGDEVLKVVSRTVTEGLRGLDVIARYGGEEFAVLLPNTPLSGALIAAEKLRQSVASKAMRRKDTGEICGNVTISIGVALYKNENDNVEAFIERADKALYMSKKGGRNKVTNETML